MYLVDSNVWLERLLSQERSEEVGRFLAAFPSEHFYITDFAFHSIGIALTRLDQTDTFRLFVQDLFVTGATNLVHLEPADLEQVLAAMQRFSLDFDDAYQYAAAAKYGLTLISFDADFDRTEHGRKPPAEALP